jgi:uncharacterized Zn finger protein (UPF0148 family)
MNEYCPQCGESCDTGEIVCAVCDRQLHASMSSDSDIEYEL